MNIDGLRNGNERAINVFVETYQKKVFHFLWKYIGNFHDTEDLVQDTLLRVINNMHLFREQDFFGAWVYKIASNIAKDYLRKKRRRDNKLRDVIFKRVHREDPCSELLNREVHSKVITSIQALPVEQREVFLMRQEAGLTFKEIAQILDIPINTALGRMHYAVEKLRKELEGVI
ncbi:RNA polymerase sigma factor [Candidatus Uabimicrobium amorphum]|uniref:RNA polymerase sigma factor n=1 Tax=Uabimicrobium amorphum TaxID=2596890 RepID=A0A5S9F1W2_UABAM|nr:sigma-70 family RNA polymerase sigma factor [Candidatus Uabimicrobium amorphum]BBM82986.1 RNA polymerase sigma factor [Candidatus Uabimicrobium amorphum]